MRISITGCGKDREGGSHCVEHKGIWCHEGHRGSGNCIEEQGVHAFGRVYTTT